AAATNIVVQATGTITFNTLGGTLTLQTGAGRSATFSTAIAGGGAISFATPTDTLATSGGGLVFNAGTTLTPGELDAGAGAVNLSAAGDVTIRTVQGGSATLA